MVSSGAEKCSFEKSPGRARRLPTSIFDAVAHFVCLPQESQPSPTGGLATLASQLSGPFPAPAHCRLEYGSAAPLQAEKQSKLMPYYCLTQRNSKLLKEKHNFSSSTVLDERLGEKNDNELEVILIHCKTQSIPRVKLFTSC